MRIQLLDSLGIIGSVDHLVVTLKTNVVRPININVDNFRKMLIAFQNIEILIPRKVFHSQTNALGSMEMRFLNDLPSQNCSPMI